MKKIFVTGAGSFIGKHLLEELAEEEVEVYALSRRESKLQYNNVHPVYGDILHTGNLSSMIASCNYFIHLAGEKKDEQKMELINVKGMKSVLDEAVKNLSLKFIYISSSGVYGIQRHDEKIINESSPCYPNNLYEQTKYQAENVLKEYALKYSLKYTILRPSNVFGEYDTDKKLLNLFHALKKKRFIYLDKNAQTNYVYVKQVSQTIAEIIRKDNFQNETYNINSPCSIFEMIESIKNNLGENYKTYIIPKSFRFLFMIGAFILELLPKTFRSFDIIKYRELTNQKIYSISKIKQVISLNEKKTLLNGFNNLIYYYKKNGWL